MPPTTWNAGLRACGLLHLRPVQSTRSTLQRSGFGYLLAIAGVVGGLSISFRAGPGLFILAFILVVVLLWCLWDAWVLMGVADEEMASERKGP